MFGKLTGSLVASVALASGLVAVNMGPSVSDCLQLRAESLVMPAECGAVADSDGTVTSDGLTLYVVACDDGVAFVLNREDSQC